MSAHRKDFDETKYISFLIRDDEWLEKHNDIWEKVESSLKKEFDSEPMHNEKYLKEINTNFRNNKIPKEGSQYICLSVFWLILFLERTKIIILKCF